jgi:phosphatidylinositol alpha-1,6-mannosyltransferase
MTEPAKPGVLLVTRNFPPLRGGMERLNRRMFEGLAKRGDVALVGPAGCSGFAPKDADVLEAPASSLWRFIPAALLATLRLAMRRRPRIVLAGSGLTAPMVWLAARLVGARSAVYLHGLDLVTPSRVYKALWLPFIRRCDIAVVNSHNTQQLAAARGVQAERMHVVHPGTDLPTLDPDCGHHFRATHGFGDRPLLLSVGRLTPRKGLAEFVQYALPSILAQHPETLLVVIGADATDALNATSGSQRKRIIETARQGGVLHALYLIPPCDDATLSAAYQAVDVHIFPVRDMPSDVEGFGMVAIEAAAHGLPTVGFRAGGVPDAILDEISGSLVEPTDYAGFAAQVLYWLARSDRSQVRAQCLSAAKAFGWDRFDECLAKILCVAPRTMHMRTEAMPGAVGREVDSDHEP